LTTKFERQGTILELIQEQPLSTQEELAEALRSKGFDAVQATVSRDIAQLGLVKVRDAEGRLVYALPGSADLDRLSELTSALRRWAMSLEASANLLVIHTPPGYANALARAIDTARLTDIIGCVAGDDTIMVVARQGVEATTIERELRHHLEGDT
jgi:transcriptional regulator of arginine metabolism